MVGSRVYDFLYSRGAPWEIGPRSELVGLVESGRLSPGALPTAVDLGCGSGANSIYLAQHGFDVTGVDFSTVAVRKSWEKARFSPGRVLFVRGDLTAPLIPGAEGPFDLLVDYGTLDDLRGARRASMVRTIHRLSRPGSLFLLWCFYGSRSELPWFSVRGPSKIFSGLDQGEEKALFGVSFLIEQLPEPEPGSGTACFLLTRR